MPGLLNAYGIGQADVRRSRQITVLEPFTADTLTQWHTRIEELATAARNKSWAKRSPQRTSRRRNHARSALPWRGSHNPRACGGGCRSAAAYAAQHRQLFGYDRPDRPLELAAIRVEVVGSVKHPEHHGSELHPSTAARFACFKW